MLKPTKKDRKPKLTLFIDVYGENDFEFAMTRDEPVSLAMVETAANRGVLYVQQEYAKDAAVEAERQRTMKTKKEKENQDVDV